VQGAWRRATIRWGRWALELSARDPLDRSGLWPLAPPGNRILAPDDSSQNVQ